MPKQISINIGFVTNSSSVVHHFPKELLQHPKIVAFLKAFEIDEGFVGSDLWHRGECATFAVTKEQKEAARSQLQNTDYGPGPAIDVDGDDFVVIYGDEHRSITATLLDVIGDALAEQHGGDRWDHIRGGEDYN
jgi:hypothetical protein